MAYTRDNALEYLQGEYATLASELGVQQVDELGGYKSVLDKAFRTLDVAQADLGTASVNDTDAGNIEALLDYHVLLRLQREASTRVSISRSTAGSSVSKQRQQVYDHITALLTDARGRVDALGLAADAEFQAGYINLDFLEPEDATL